ncbi:MAG: hypothetical protein Q4D26_06020 [Clostridia bacterium]|nr:hypothetical protein [Clostridia bacterium]
MDIIMEMAAAADMITMDIIMEMAVAAGMTIIMMRMMLKKE